MHHEFPRNTSSGAQKFSQSNFPIYSRVYREYCRLAIAFCMLSSILKYVVIPKLVYNCDTST